jgi:multiple antibiotic resistance protein
MLLLWQHFAIGFSALLPVVNPLGSALVFLGLVGMQPPAVYRSLARQIAINVILFFVVIELVGSYLLGFFGISLAIVQLAGGLVLAAMGWSLLNQKDADAARDSQVPTPCPAPIQNNNFEDKVFYPLTFPITAGPGCIVVMLTLSAHATAKSLSGNLLAHAGLLLAAVVLSWLVYISYAYAPQITRAIAPSTVHGILRVIAFILLCIGVQIAWNGLSPLLATLLHPA